MLAIGTPGNAATYESSNQTPMTDSPLKNHYILCLGSSVVEGNFARRNSFANYMEAIDGAKIVKESVSGTTIADLDDSSYLVRLKNNHPASEPVELVIVQLSTNDATQDTVMGELSDSYDLADFDTRTSMGAFEAIMAYCKETWDCLVVIFTVPSTHNERISESYGALVDLTSEMTEKWDAQVLDFWYGEKFNSITDEQWSFWMANASHPKRTGYLEWWKPAFREFLSKYFED